MSVPKERPLIVSEVSIVRTLLRAAEATMQLPLDLEVGDRVYVKETTAFWWNYTKCGDGETGFPDRVLGYKADCPPECEHAEDPWWEQCDWVPPQRCPKWASRIRLEVLRVVDAQTYALKVSVDRGDKWIPRDRRPA